MKLRSINNIDIAGKFVLLRDDFNVQVVDGKITDAFRIQQSMPTIKKLRDAGAKIAICAHFGRPKGVRNMEFSLAGVAQYLNTPLVPDCLDKDFMANMKNGDVVLLENLRFYAGEEKNDEDFAKKLAAGFDIFVNDAFGVSHRAHASTVGVTKFLPAYAGDLLSFEIEKLSNVMSNPVHPLLAIVGGNKIESKIGVIKSLVKIADKMMIVGALGTTFNCARGEKVGRSLCEMDMKDKAIEIMDFAKENNCELYFPVDKGVAKEFKPDSPRMNKPAEDVEDDDIILDEGPASIARNLEVINSVKTVIWNGPLGMAEWYPLWAQGTFAVAVEIAKLTKAGKIESICGGGDTVAALEVTGLKDDFTYVSTGGGAFLEFVEGKILPGIAVLEDK